MTYHSPPPFSPPFVIHRAFRQYVEEGLGRAGIYYATAAVSPHMPLQAIMKQLILEGVRVIFRLDRRHETSGLVSLQLFEATPPGTAPSLNVKYDEYENIRLEDAINIITTARQATQASALHPPVPSARGSAFGVGGGMGNELPPNRALAPQAQGHIPPGQGQPSANSGSIDIGAISALLGSLRPPVSQQGSQTPTPAAPAPHAPPQTSSSTSMDASQLLAMLQGPPSNQ